MTTPQRQYRYYEFVMAAFVTVLVCSNLIGPAKIAQFEVPLLGALICATLLVVRAITGEGVAPLIAGGLALGILVLYFATRHSHRPAEL